jgi:hypothetical protein
MKFRFIPFLSFLQFGEPSSRVSNQKDLSAKKEEKNLDCGRNSAGGHPVTNSTKLQRMCLIKKPVVAYDIESSM